jgi:phenylacetate-coenzyme A ligase PaaK-like adenylate-forming protein
VLTRALLRGLFLPLAECVTRTRFWTYYRESLRFERWSSARREKLRGRRLAEVWNAALATALHQKRLSEAGLPGEVPDADTAFDLLGKLPPVGKATLRRHFPGGVTNGSQAADWRFQSTAGTTDRMTVVADFRKRDHGRSSELRVLHMALGEEVGVGIVEIPPNACNLVCGLVDTGPPSLLGYLWQALRQGNVVSSVAMTELRGRIERQLIHRLHTLPPIDPLPADKLTDALDQYLKQIVQLRPAYLRGFPVYLLWLADRCRDICPSPAWLKAVGPYGGLASPVMMNRIASGLDCRFVQKYGTSELGVVGAACGHSVAMHVFEDLFHVEVLRRGEPVAHGEVGRLVITDLVNTAMPLIRYEVGDVGRLHVGPCPCGRQSPRLEVLGRLQEVLDAPGSVLTASDVADTVFCDPGACNFRLEEVAPGSFEAALVAGAAGSRPNLDAWCERFAGLHGGVRRMRARLVPFVQPESSGKYRFVLPQANRGEVL